jgi:CRP-like cAMP-binding protein
LRAITIFKDLHDAALDEIFPALLRRPVRQRRALALSKHFSGHLCFAWSGRYRVLAATPSGGSINMYSLEPGGLFNQSVATLGLNPSDHVRLIADAPGLILMLPQSDAERLLDTCPPFARALMRALALLNIDYAQRIFEIATLDARALLLAELSRLAETGIRHGDQIIVSPAPTQSAMAQQLGLSREAVSRNLRALSDENLVRVDRGRITVPNIERLRASHRQGAGANLIHRPHKS